MSAFHHTVFKFSTFLELPLIFTDSNFMMKNGLINQIRREKNRIHGSVLDFGCGAKPYENEFIHCDSYIGVDIKHSGHNHVDSKVDFYYDGEKLPWPDETFDSIVSFEVFEHLPSPSKSLKEIERVLKPGGALMLTVPFLYGEHEIPYDFQRWTSFGIKKFFENSEFINIEIYKINTTPAFALQLFVNIFMNKIMYHQNKKLRYIFSPFILFSNLMLQLLRIVLPSTDWFYSNSLVIARKREKD